METKNKAVFSKDGSNRIIADDLSANECCGEVLSFAMKDNFHEFSIGLNTILQCVRVAEDSGYLPPLPVEWWRQVWRMY